MKKFVSYFVVAVLGGIISTSLNHYLFPPAKNNIVQTTNIPVKTVSFSNVPEVPNFVEAAEMSIHAVVHVKTKYTYQQTYYNPFQSWFFGNGMQVIPREEHGSGSGVIISPDGYIVTNYHVISKADEIEVTLNDKRTFSATLIGADPSTDIAVLKINETNLPFLPYGNSDNVKVGEWVLAVGNPFNLASTVTAGIISAKARNINIISGNGSGPSAIESFIQTDAAVNPGNSGGALVNTSGQLIGINTAIASNTGSFAGYSFAIPVNIVKKVVADIIEFGSVQRGYLGVSIREVDEKSAKENGLSSPKGIYIEAVVNGGAADEAGLQSGDIITSVNGIEVNNIPEFQEQISRYRPGDKVVLNFIRNKDNKSVSVILRDLNNSIKLSSKSSKNTAVVELLGALFEPASKEELQRLSISNGLKVIKLSAGKLRSAGIREGFIITAIDKRPIKSIDDLKEALENKKGGVLIEGVYPNGIRAYYAFGI